MAVSQYRLATHLGLAIVLFGYILWTALETIGAQRTRVASAAGLRPWVVALAALVFVQMLLGAFMAGLDAGRAFSDWPSYGGQSIPAGLYDLQPWWINHLENPAMVHFQHRTVGYVVALMVVWLYAGIILIGADKPLRVAANHAALLVVLQFALGVFTVITMVSLPFAVLHQVCALLLFGAALWWVYVLSPYRSWPVMRIET